MEMKQRDGRALRRNGSGIPRGSRVRELLKEFDGRGEHMKKEGALLSSQEQAAEAAGISEHQRKQAVRVANVPASTFAAAIESDKPSTVTALAEMGTKVPEVSVVRS